MAFRVQVTKGEPLPLALEVVSGHAVGATIRCVMKRAVKGQVPPESAPAALELTTTWTESLGEGLGPGWFVTGSTENLAVDDYYLDARVVLSDGYVDSTEMIQVTILPRITAP